MADMAQSTSIDAEDEPVAASLAAVRQTTQAGTMSQRTVHVRVEGRVQGVGYRAFVARSARELGVNGWVRNRRDSSVEAVLQGAASEIALMLGRCEHGPPGAGVTRVEVLGEGVGVFDGFEVRPTV